MLLFQLVLPMHYCQTCSRELDDNILYCPNCGTLQNKNAVQSRDYLRPQEHDLTSSFQGNFGMPSFPRKNPWLAGILNFFLPGLGYVYNGIGRERSQIIFGFFVFLSVFLGVYVPLFGAPAAPSSSSAPSQVTVFDLLTLLILILPIGLAYDGYARANRINSSSRIQK
jgi:hypothetical protein